VTVAWRRQMRHLFRISMHGSNSAGKLAGGSYAAAAAALLLCMLAQQNLSAVAGENLCGMACLYEMRNSGDLQAACGTAYDNGVANNIRNMRGAMAKGWLASKCIWYQCPANVS